jgi:nucleotide-binding universal stress UspA family protein
MAPIKIERILCPVDFSEFSVGAYSYASSLAQRYGAKLFVQHVVEMWRHPSAYFAVKVDLYAEFSQLFLKRAEEELQTFVRSHAQNGVRPESVIREGLATDGILSLADEQKIDLIVMGTHGRRGMDRLMLGSVTERVLREAHCPVLAIRKPPRNFVASATGRHVIELRRILFCTDFSDYSNRALDYALYLAAEHNSELMLVHALEDAPKPARVKATIAKANEALGKLIPPEAKKRYRIATTVRIGRAYQEIVQLASEMDADLVIMAVRGRNSLDLLVFGSTTYRVIQLSTCPVLAVHL